MPKSPAGLVLESIRLASSGPPLHRQLYLAIREHILAGSLKPADRLPSTRTLAGELEVSRNTVVLAYEQLTLEDFLESRVGDGTYVSEAARAVESLIVPPRAASGRRRPNEDSEAAWFSVNTTPSKIRPFAVGMPALDMFPADLWRRLLVRRSRVSGADLMAYGEAAGYRPLRRAVATHLTLTRGLRCSPEQVVTVSSAQQAIDLAARLLSRPGDPVWMEEPGYPGARGALAAAGARIVPVPVDEQGLVVEAGVAAEPEARLAYVSPSHQYPLGATMSLERRLTLLAWARSAGAWILEDDYDSEFRFRGPPLAPLQGLDTAGRVIYIGTFSKVLFPALRQAYLVVPNELLEPLLKLRSRVDRYPPVLMQAVLADFLEQGHFAAHLRRMRALYRNRCDALIQALEARFGSVLTRGPCDTGMHLAVTLAPGLDDHLVANRAAGRGIEVHPLSHYYAGSSSRPGLLLGFSAVGVREIRRGVDELAHAVAEVRNPDERAPGPPLGRRSS